MDNDDATDWIRGRLREVTEDESIGKLMREAMRWAYKDAARECMQVAKDSVDLVGEHNGAVKCANAIRRLA